MGVRGRLPWQVSATDELFDDFMIRPLGVEAGQVIEYLPLPEEYLSKQLAGKSVLLVGENDTTVEMARAASSAGALVQVVGATAEISTIKLILESLATLDMLFISAGPTSVAGTLETDAAAWERLFDAHCKGALTTLLPMHCRCCGKASGPALSWWRLPRFVTLKA